MILRESDFAHMFPSMVLSNRLEDFPGVMNDTRWVTTGVSPDCSTAPFQEFTFSLPDAQAIYPNVIVVAGGRLLDTNAGYVSSELVAHGVADFPLTRTGGRVELRQPASWAEFDMCAYMVASANYSAFLLGELPRLEAYRPLFANGASLVIHGELMPFHRELLSMVGLAEADVSVVPKEVGVKSAVLFHATPTYLHWNPSPGALAYLRARLAPQVDAVGGPSRVYVSRSRLGPDSDRYIVNELELEAHLSRQGFAILHPQDVSVAEQLRAFACADILIAPFGAAWANSLFRKPNSHSAMLVTKWSPEFSRLMQYAKQSMSLIPTGRAKVRDDNRESRAYDFKVRAEDLRLIDEFIARATGS